MRKKNLNYELFVKNTKKYQLRYKALYLSNIHKYAYIKVVLTLHYIEGILFNCGEDLLLLLHLILYHIFHAVRPFAIICIKIHVYFSIKTDFFYFIYLLLKKLYIQIIYFKIFF